MDNIYAELRELKKNSGLSFAKLGGKLGIARSTLHQIFLSGRLPGNIRIDELRGKISDLRELFGNNGKYGNYGKNKNNKKKGDIMEALTFEAMEKFGLERDPFLNEIDGPDDFYYTGDSRRYINEILSAIKRKKFIALIGEVGSGKTVLMNHVENDLQRDIKLIRISNIHKKRLGPNHIIDAIHMVISGKHRSLSGSMEARCKKVISALEDGTKGDQKYCIVIDDAHQLPTYTIRSLKQLYDLQYGFERLTGIILLGQLEMLDILMDIRLRETTQRCSLYLMCGLVKPDEIYKYLYFKIDRAGGDARKIFDKKIYNMIGKQLTFSVQFGRRRFNVCPILRVQNLAARLMNEAAELDEDTVKPEMMMVGN